MAYIGLEPKSSHTIKYSQPLELVLFHVISLCIKCLKGSYYPHLLNNYLINYLIFLESYTTTLQYSIILVAQQGLHLHLMDDVTTYSYGSFENENHIYMKIPEGFYLLNKTNSKEGYSIKLNMLFY